MALEDDGGEGEFLFWQAELGAEKYLGRPASGQSHEAHAFFEVAVAGQEGESFLDEGLRVQRDQVGLVLVDALMMSETGKPTVKRSRSDRRRPRPPGSARSVVGTRRPGSVIVPITPSNVPESNSGASDFYREDAALPRSGSVRRQR